jgi:hypothetical protein
MVCEAFPVFSEYSMPNKRWEFWIIGVGSLEIYFIILLADTSDATNAQRRLLRRGCDTNASGKQGKYKKLLSCKQFSYTA